MAASVVPFGGYELQKRQFTAEMETVLMKISGGHGRALKAVDASGWAESRAPLHSDYGWKTEVYKAQKRGVLECTEFTDLQEQYLNALRSWCMHRMSSS